MRAGDTIEKQMWIGLANVVSADDSGVFDKALGAYVNVVALAYDRSHFREQVRKAAIEMRIDVLSIEEIEPFDERKKHFQISEELLSLEEQAEETGSARFARFHTYRSDTDIN